MDQGGKIHLKSGKEITPNRGIIGLGPAPKFVVAQGGDADYLDDETLDASDWRFLTRDERLEICDVMLARWQEFKNHLAIQEGK